MTVKILGRGKWLALPELLALLTLSVGVCSWADEEQAKPTLSQAVAHLIEAQAHLQSASAAASLVLPSGLTDVLIVRRTIAADWQRRLDAMTVRAEDANLQRFTSELEVLVSGLQQLANLTQQLGDAPRRFPHCLSEPVFTRYRTLVRDAFEQGVQAVSAGRLRDQVAPAAWFQRQARYVTVLQLIESSHLADEKYASLPRDDRWLIEYREHLLLKRNALESRLEQDEDDESFPHLSLFDPYVQLLDLRVNLLPRIAASGLPKEAPEVATFRRACEMQVAVLGRQIGLTRNVPGDDEEAWQREDRERRQLSKAERLTELADEWLSFEQERRETAANITEQLSDAPVEVVAPTRAALEALALAHQTSQVAFDQAIAAGDLSAALTAKHAVERTRQQADHQLLHLDEDITIIEREKIWRAHAQDPAIAEKLREWDERRAAFLKARQAAEAAVDVDLVARQAVERAHLVSDEAHANAETLRNSADMVDIFELSEALDEMVELRAGALIPPP